MSWAVIEPNSLPSSPALPLSVSADRAELGGEALGLRALGLVAGAARAGLGRDPLLVALGGLEGEAAAAGDNSARSPA